MVRHKSEREIATISDQRLIGAMAKVGDRFSPPDESTPAQQTASDRRVVAGMIQALQPRPEGRVLEVGIGSGYQTAILAELAGSVYAVEIDPARAKQAHERLRAQGYRNIQLRIGDGNGGWIEEAPFDSIIVNEAVEDVPPPLMDQLRDGGRLVVPLGTPFGPQELTLVEKHGTTVITRSLRPPRFVSFRRVLGQKAKD
jgi:protein-L-isoaspartate(D-aspartate) O-methyltransferase